MLALRICASFTLAGFAAAFVPSAIQPNYAHQLRPNGRVISTLALSALPEVFPGVHLPENEVPTPFPPMDPRENPVEQKVGRFVLQAIPAVAVLNRQPKAKDSLDSLQPLMLQSVEAASVGLAPVPTNYKPFGNGDNLKTLTTLLKTDPFFASALTKTKRGFELRSFDTSDPNNDKDASLFRKMAGTLTGAGHRINFYFDKNMEFKKLRVYDDVMGKRIFQLCKDEEDVDLWASSALYNLFFYASSIHATIHVLHYLMTSAFQYVTEDFPAMHQWAKYYAYNIQGKYAQVGDVLIRYPPTFDPKGADPANGKRLNAVITGKNGLGSVEEEIRPILADLLNSWGKCSTAQELLDGMMNISTEDMDRAGILTEFRKHVDIIPPFAKEVAGAFHAIDQDKTTTAESRLKEYLKNCGEFTSDIDSLETWIELMSITGDIHGGTLGYTRLVAMADVMKWRSIGDPKWDSAELFNIAVVAATIEGSESGRYVMTSTIDAPYDDKLQVVLDKYDGKATLLKEEYQANIQKDPDFLDFGWILSIYCTDGFDGKRMTTATYI